MTTATVMSTTPVMDDGGPDAIVFHKRNRKPWIVVMDAQEFIALLSHERTPRCQAEGGGSILKRKRVHDTAPRGIFMRAMTQLFFEGDRNAEITQKPKTVKRNK